MDLDFSRLPVRLKCAFLGKTLLPLSFFSLVGVRVSSGRSVDGVGQCAHGCPLMMELDGHGSIQLGFGFYNLFFIKSLADFILDEPSPFQFAEKDTMQVVELASIIQEYCLFPLEVVYKHYSSGSIVVEGGFNECLWIGGCVGERPISEFLIEEEGVFGLEFSRPSGYWVLAVSTREEPAFYEMQVSLEVSLLKQGFQWRFNRKRGLKLVVSNLHSVSIGVPPSAADIPSLAAVRGSGEFRADEKG